MCAAKSLPALRRGAALAGVELAPDGRVEPVDQKTTLVRLTPPRTIRRVLVVDATVGVHILYVEVSPNEAGDLMVRIRDR